MQMKSTSYFSSLRLGVDTANFGIQDLLFMIIFRLVSFLVQCMQDGIHKDCQPFIVFSDEGKNVGCPILPVLFFAFRDSRHLVPVDTDYDPASLTSPQCDGYEMGGRQLPRVPIQFLPTRRATPLFILPKKLELLDPTHRGLHRFIPRHYDEVEIDIGDPVYVQKEAEDLWCEGANLRTGKIGIFPLAHVVDVEYNDFDPNGVSSERKERYLLEYIGSVESHLYKGNAVLCQAVKKIVGAKMAPKRHACVIEISDKGIKMIDKSRLNLSRHPNQDYFYSLKNVTFCGFHPSNSQYFGFVTKHPKLPKYACHVFVGEGSTQHVAEACGRAFNRFYQKFIETAYPVEDIYLE